MDKGGTLTAEQVNQIVEHFMPVAGSIAKLTMNKWPQVYEYTELLSITSEALWKAVVSYNGKGTFVAYAKQRIKWALLDYSRYADDSYGRYTKIKYLKLPLDTKINDFDETIADVLVAKTPTPYQLCKHNDELERVLIYVTRICDERTQTLFKLYHIEDFSYREAGKVIGVCESRAHQMIREVMDRLKLHFIRKD